MPTLILSIVLLIHPRLIVPLSLYILMTSMIAIVSPMISFALLMSMHINMMILLLLRLHGNLNWDRG
jgi:hypothetical protein